MKIKLNTLFLFLFLLFPVMATAQFSGPVIDRAELTVEQAMEARIGTYANITGNIINRLHEEYYTFRDSTGEIRVEIAENVWQNQQVSPEDEVRLFVEVDSNAFGRRYLWVESLEVLD